MKRLLAALAILLLSASAFAQMPVPANQLRQVVAGGSCGAGTITQVQNIGSASTGTAASLATSSWTLSTVGNVIAVGTTWDATGTPTGSVVDSLGNSCSATVNGRRGPSSNGQYLQWFICTVTNTGTGHLTLNVSPNTGSLGIFATEFHISSGTMAFDDEAYNAAAATTTPTSGSKTPSCNNSAAMGFVESGGTGTAGSGWTLGAAASIFVTAEWQIQTTATSLQANFTTGSFAYGAGMMILKPQ